jgi:hypothetical protein
MSKIEKSAFDSWVFLSLCKNPKSKEHSSKIAEHSLNPGVAPHGATFADLAFLDFFMHYRYIF